MKDTIDKRNERESIARSIVKRRNIIYTSKEDLERKQEEERQKERQAADDLVKKLKDDANQKMAMEIQRLIADREMLERQLETGMDATGKKLMNEVTQERVEAILSEKSRQLQDIISASSITLAQKSEPVEVSVPETDQETDGSTSEGTVS